MTIDHFIPATVRDNVARIERCPNYIFSFEGSFHYALVKEYWPEEWRHLRECVRRGRWAVAGSFVNACDVNIPAPESLVRQILYGNAFFRRELGTESADIMLPDCFGFGYALPSVAAHCGLKGFSTQKLTWGAALTPPFDIGLWQGPDGKGIVAAIQAGNYAAFNEPGLEANQEWIAKVRANKAASGMAIAYRYFGTGDRGGAPGEESCLNLEAAIAAGAPLRVKCIRSDAMAAGLTKAQVAGLPRYSGELLMTAHGAGCYTSQAALKRLNRANERMAQAAERAALGAHWLGAAKYPRAVIEEAWTGFLWHQFHDDLTGTGLPTTYPFSWNDHAISWNRFATVFTDSVGAMARRLDTCSAKGVPLAVHNPLEYAREEVVEAILPAPAPNSAVFVRVFGPAGEVPAQVVRRGDDSLVVAFLAKVPAAGVALFDARFADEPASFDTGLRAGEREVENRRYLVTVNEAGDIASVYDKSLGRELLSAPHGLETRPDESTPWPAWEILHAAVSAPARTRAGAPAAIRVAESGPVRVAIEVTRRCEGSLIVQKISLDASPGAARVEVLTDVDWRSRDALLKAVFPLAADAPAATYDLGCGVIERGANTPSLYEVPAQRWADVTDSRGKFGVAVMSDCKYGWDRPDTRTLRLTLLHTPSKARNEFRMQEELDLGRHRFRYAIAGHAGDWRAGRMWRQAASFDQPLTAVRVPAIPGGTVREFGLVEVLNDAIGMQALKLAEAGDEWIVRLDEKAGHGVKGARVAFAARIESVRELDGQERELRKLPKPAGRELKLDFGPFQMRTLAVRVAPPKDKLSLYQHRMVWFKEPLDLQVTNRDGFEAAGPGFDAGHYIPAEVMPLRVYDGPVCYHIQNRSGLGAAEATACRGETLSLGKKAVEKSSLWILAAADGADVLGRFGIGGRTVELLIQRGGGFVGQWDRRSHPSYANGTLVGARTAPMEGGGAFYKGGRIAWLTSHRHDAQGRNKSWDHCYLFSHRIPLPDGVSTVTLPDDERIRILSMSIVEDGGRGEAVASLEHPFTLRQTRHLSR
jgi:alpha-mannosidase